MQSVLENRPEILAADYRQQLQQWIDAMLDPVHVGASGPTRLNANRH
jgi:hypothetical protein